LRWAASLRHLGFDGLRIDTVPEVKPAFWAEFTSAAAMITIGSDAAARVRLKTEAKCLD
jgi:glycosidase